MKLKDLKNIKLEKVKTIIDLTEWRSAGKQGIDKLISTKEFETVGDLISSKTIDLIKRKIGYYSKDELLHFVNNEVVKVQNNDPSYTKLIIEEMKKQHTYCWELLLREQLFILKEDLEKDYAVIWCRGLCDDEIGTYAKKSHLYVKQDESLDFSDIEDKELKAELEHEYFVKGDLYYKELYPYIKDYLIPLPVNTKVIKRKLIFEDIFKGLVKKFKKKQ